MADSKPLKIRSSGRRGEFETGDTLAIAHGGTGAPDAATARSNLGIARAFRGHIHGLTLSNNVGDANNDIDISAGEAWDNTNDALLVLTSGITKRLDASWTVGTGNGGLDTGSKANSTTYHVWLISNGTTVDALFSTSASSPTMPGGYTLSRRIGSVITDGSGAIRGFVQSGDTFLYKTGVTDANGVSQGTTSSLFTLTVPAGLQVQPLLSACFGSLAATTIGVYVSSPAQNDLAVALPNAYTHGSLSASAAAAPLGTNHRLLTDTSRRIRVISTHASTLIYIGTAGWIDTRGRDA